MNRFLEISLLALFLGFTACEEGADPSPAITVDCSSSQSAVYQESDGLLTIDLENAQVSEGWEKRNTLREFTGTGYLLWKGGDQFNKPGAGLLTYRLQISNPGTYRIRIRSFIAEGGDHTESNDVWIRVADADDFFAQKDTSIIYPKGSGKTPNPNGSSTEGWFKSYMSQLNNWTWQTLTSDHDPHDIFATFNKSGTYTLELSGRSEGFAIDRVVLYNPDLVMENDAINSQQAQSVVACQ